VTHNDIHATLLDYLSPHKISSRRFGKQSTRCDILFPLACRGRMECNGWCSTWMFLAIEDVLGYLDRLEMSLSGT